MERTQQILPPTEDISLESTKKLKFAKKSGPKCLSIF